MKNKIDKLQNEMVKSLNYIKQSSGNPDVMAAGFYLLGNTLRDSGNVGYAARCYEKSNILRETINISNDLVTSKLIDSYFAVGKITKVDQILASFAEKGQKDIKNAPAIGGEINEVFQTRYKDDENLKDLLEELDDAIQLKDKIQTARQILQQQEAEQINNEHNAEQILTQKFQSLHLNARIVNPERVDLDDKAREALDQILEMLPEQLQEEFKEYDLGNYVKKMFENQVNHIQEVEQKLNIAMEELALKIDKKPDQEQIDKTFNLVEKK